MRSLLDRISFSWWLCLFRVPGVRRSFYAVLRLRRSRSLVRFGPRRRRLVVKVAHLAGGDYVLWRGRQMSGIRSQRLRHRSLSRVLCLGAAAELWNLLRT
eukprot:1867118-Alexandrium_andersonii.AAC.1